MKLKYLLKKTINIKSSYLVMLIVGMLVVIGGCVSYAIFTVTNESKGVLNIVTGNLYSYIDSIDLDKNKSVTVEPGSVTTVTLKLLNVNGIDAKLNLYYSTTNSNIDIGYLASGDAAPTTDGYVLGKNGSDSESKTIYVQIKNNGSSIATVTFGSDVGLSTATLAFPSDKSSLNRISNNYISAVYNYDDENDATKCITGEEATCQVSDCITNMDKNSCSAGTIVKYKIKDDEEKFFYVLHDDGDKLTLQQRENTTDNTLWCSKEDYVEQQGVDIEYGDTGNNSKGPVTAIKSLENFTNSWVNVNEQQYILGTTKFNDTNEFTGCDSYSSCSKNTYTLDQRNARARLITLQELNALGCTTSEKSCPIWISNYLKQSTAYGGTTDSESLGYYTSSALSSNLNSSWYVGAVGNVYYDSIKSSDKAVRAVVEVSK